jgi:ubiquinone/menaquinone biosynthesis C-methylase UbiE
MTVKSAVRRFANVGLRPFGFEIVRRSAPELREFLPPDRVERSWDRQFLNWIAEARRTGTDPNDMGDRAWGVPDNVLLERRYLSFMTSESVVLELGPGTGRISRHLIGRCRDLILMDYSQVVCQWLGEYLAGKGPHRIVLIDRPVLTGVSDDSIDLVVADGVFEHIDLDDFVCFLEEFCRVLKRGGIAAFNFDNIMAEESWSWWNRTRGHPGTRNNFRFHHPDAVARIAEKVGLRVHQLETSENRQAYVWLQKPSLRASTWAMSKSAPLGVR